MASPTTATAPNAVDTTPAASDSTGGDGNSQATTAGGAAEDGESSSSPAADAAAAGAEAARSPVATTTRRRSAALLTFPTAAPAYDTSPAPARAALPGVPPPGNNTSAPPTGIATTASPPGGPTLRSALRPASPNPAQHGMAGSSRRSSMFGERPSLLERRAAEAQAGLEAANQLRAEIATVEDQVSRVERELEDVQRAVARGESYRGKDGKALAEEEGRLARKERLLREKEGQLREERLVLMRSRSDQQRRGSEVAARQRRVAWVVTQSHPDDPEQERAAQQRVAQIEDMVNRRQSISSGGGGAGGGPDGVHYGGGSEREFLQGGSLLNDFSAVQEIFTPEEDSRLAVRMQAFQQPVLVGTLLSGFTLVLFDVATTDLARRLAVLAFALEMSSSTVLCLIMFRAQQLYSHASDVKPRARKFLSSMFAATVVSLVMFSLGVIAFVVSFVVEARDEMEDLWLVVFAVILCPTALAAVLFAASTANVKRFSVMRRQQAAVSQTE